MSTEKNVSATDTQNEDLSMESSSHLKHTISMLEGEIERLKSKIHKLEKIEHEYKVLKRNIQGLLTPDDHGLPF